jgi:uncharacterized membrane protein (UPF0127 family)
MQLRLTGLLTAWLLLICSLPCNADESRFALDSFPKDKLDILTTDARVHPIAIWLATDEPHRMQGLMFVKAMNDDQGMLFIYPSERTISMWMKNTLIPLDMVFISSDGHVQQIENAKPQSLHIIESKQEVVAVLELKGGAAKRFGIEPGARISYKAFGMAAPR